MSQTDFITIVEDEEFDDMGSYTPSLVQGNLTYLLRQVGNYSVFIELSLDASSLDKQEFPNIANELIPDICLYPKRGTIPRDILRVTEMPLLAIEVISPRQGTLGLIEKFQVYFALGITSCWLVDPALNIVAVYSSPTEYRTFAGETVIDEQLAIEIPRVEIFE
jgi:Uma2 family endonuclease